MKRKHPKAHEIYEFHHKRSKVNNSTSRELSQSKFDDLLQKFLIDGLKTLSMVEEPAFKAFVYGMYLHDSSVREIDLICSYNKLATDFCDWLHFLPVTYNGTKQFQIMNLYFTHMSILIVLFIFSFESFIIPLRCF